MASDDTPGICCPVAAAPGSLLEGWRSALVPASNGADPRQQFLGLLEKAPDVEAMLDEQAGVWTVVLPPPTDLDAGREIRGCLSEVAAAVTEYLGNRDRLLHAARCAQLDVLRARWDERFEVGWDGEWWCQSRDGAGERERAVSPEQLNRLMGQSVTHFPGTAGATEKEGPGAGLQGHTAGRGSPARRTAQQRGRAAGQLRVSTSAEN
jgi:hypothetical protein